MHQSRFKGFIIDCKIKNPNAKALKKATQFWSKALGMPSEKRPRHPEKYVALDAEAEGLFVEVQSVKHPSRVHLDLETDNIEAEVKRLKKLGAKVVRKVHTWVVMEAPTGHRFCVTKVMSKDFKKTAKRWR